MSRGKVYLVGAGPGDPDLITVKGLRLLRRAHVVVYDRLIPFELLEETDPEAELIDAGKQPTRHRLAQEEINAILINRAREGHTVLRLKGGDPFVFGRGAEEALACRRHGIPFEIVPGVSSVNAVPAYAGIPLTHRHVSSSFTVITGHEDPAKPESSINYRALAQVGGAIVILMGVNKLGDITRQLQKHGMDGEIPAAVIEWGATRRQRTLVGTLDTIANISQAHAIQPPAITILGDVVRLRQAGVAWFDLLPDDVVLSTMAPAMLP